MVINVLWIQQNLLLYANNSNQNIPTFYEESILSSPHWATSSFATCLHVATRHLTHPTVNPGQLTQQSITAARSSDACVLCGVSTLSWSRVSCFHRPSTSPHMTWCPPCGPWSWWDPRSRVMRWALAPNPVCERHPNKQRRVHEMFNRARKTRLQTGDESPPT